MMNSLSGAWQMDAARHTTAIDGVADGANTSATEPGVRGEFRLTRGHRQRIDLLTGLATTPEGRGASESAVEQDAGQRTLE
jgi:hypothetical protein